MSNQANARATLAAVLGTIQTTAHTVTSTLDAANKSVGMLNKLVTDAAKRQDVRSKLDMAIFTATVHQEKAQELTESRINVDNYVAKSPRHKELYQSAYNELAAILTPATTA